MDKSEFELHASIEDAHWWFKARREIIFEQLKKYVPPGSGKVIAEIGCGTGGNLKFLQDYYHVIGIDSSMEAVHYASERVKAGVLHGDFHTVLKGRWKDLDGVILADVLEHVDDDSTMVRDIVSCLKHNAILLITVPAHRFLWSSHDVVLGHKRRYSAGSLRALWAKLPVRELFFSPFNSLLFPAIALSRLLRFHGQERVASDLRLPSPATNDLLYRIFSFERILLKYLPLPCGVSYLAVIRIDNGEIHA